MIDSFILPKDEQVSGQLRRLYRQHGYLPYRMSKFEEYDLYVRNKNFLTSDNILTFTDTDGRLMALKPDVTLSIVKNTPDASSGLQKVYYNENVYRTSSAAVGYREIMQTGLECIGQLDLYAMGEVISLADASLSLIGGDYLLDMSHAGIVSGLLNNVENDLRASVLTEIGRKNTGAIRDLCAQAGLSQDLADKISKLAMLYGTPEQVLPQLEELIAGKQAEDALTELKALCSLLNDMGHSSHLRLDFSIVNDMSYYNGVIFRGYLPGLASGVLAGGRYDNLLRRMGKQGQAIGFAVYLDQLDRLPGNSAAYDVDILLLYRDSDNYAAVTARANALRAQGYSVRIERSIPQGLRYAGLQQFGEGGAN